MIVGLAANNGGGSERAAPEATATSLPGATPTPNAAERAAELAKEIPDPKVRAAHLLRRAGFGGTPAQVDEFATLSREEAADRLLNLEAADNSALNARIAAANFNLTTFAEAPMAGAPLFATCSGGG